MKNKQREKGKQGLLKITFFIESADNWTEILGVQI